MRWEIKRLFFLFFYRFFGRFKAWVPWKVWKAAQCSYIQWQRPALHHRILADRPVGERRGKISSGCNFYDIKNDLWEITACCLDCGVSGQWSAGVQKLHLLSTAARLHEGHQHPPALPPHQHPAGPPDLQGPERSHRHTQGEAHTAQPRTEVSCWHTLVPHLGRPDLQLCTSYPPASFLLTQTH